MVKKILDALLLTRRLDPAKFAQIVEMLGKGRTPLEFDAPEIARLPWEEVYHGAYGSRKFSANVKGAKVFMTLEPIDKELYQVRSVEYAH